MPKYWIPESKRWTPERAKASLDADIRKAHEAYERRLAQIAQERNQPSRPTKSQLAEAAAERRKAVMSLYDSGLNQRQIAERVGMNRSHVGELIRSETSRRQMDPTPPKAS